MDITAVAIRLWLLCLLAHAATAACPLSGLLGDMGGYNKDLFALQLAGANATHTPPAAGTPSLGPKSSCNATGFKAVAADILSSMESRSKGGPGLEAPRATRAAFHSAATFRPASGSGGPNGGHIRFKEEFSFPENAGIDEAVEALDAIAAKHPCITFADLLTLAGTIAVEFAGGPAIAWIPGRRDATAPLASGGPLAASLPDGAFNAAAVMYWGTNLGLSAREVVAFTGGGHSFGAANFKNSGWNGSFSPDKDEWPEGAKNRWFTHLVNLEWTPETVPFSNRMQFVPKGAPDLVGENGGPIIRFPSDIAMLQAGGALGHWTSVYARNEKQFLADFARVFQRMMQLGAGLGQAWALAPQQFTWLGVNGTATNYGTAIKPQDSSYDEEATPSLLVQEKASSCRADAAGDAGSAKPAAKASGAAGLSVSDSLLMGWAAVAVLLMV